ncbi:hypothetical protein PTTG_05775 [Puccinia triticina 1-1 BBBD Race 1]|uniref:Uncharacterized protein n=1 Tax=Puccinia triticina (isolate 1-1 / race 1 (BBBD)) TaxID=630390 RepID=A0A0C4EY76_PUCT1|nr:hypothetical protein PTTG_05775 [Puccinia triticina 1-1 BBBD Race 1]
MWSPDPENLHSFANKGNTRAEGTVVDVCTFDENDRKLTIEEGCSMIYVTRAMFRALGGKSGADSMVIDNWDLAQLKY